MADCVNLGPANEGCLRCIASRQDDAVEAATGRLLNHWQYARDGAKLTVQRKLAD
ncbi:hypothetical protein D3C84_1099110 [compost metagenome]